MALMLLNPNIERPSYPGLANLIGRHRVYVHDVCTEKIYAPPTREAVAAALHVQPDQIWTPDPHAPHGAASEGA
jgi:hypothetical protein